MKIKIVEIGLNDPVKRLRRLVETSDPAVGEYDEESEKLFSISTNLPQVTCRCLCTDCIYNENNFCIAENIDLDYAKTDDGRIICECKTYEISDKE